MPSDYRPRLTIELEQELLDKLRVLLPHGTQRIVFHFIILDLIEMMEQLGSGQVIGAFINRDVKLKKLLRMDI